MVLSIHCDDISVLAANHHAALPHLALLYISTCHFQGRISAAILISILHCVHYSLTDTLRLNTCYCLQDSIISQQLLQTICDIYFTALQLALTHHPLPFSSLCSLLLKQPAGN